MAHFPANRCHTSTCGGTDAWWRTRARRSDKPACRSPLVESGRRKALDRDRRARAVPLIIRATECASERSPRNLAAVVDAAEDDAFSDPSRSFPGLRYERTGQVSGCEPQGRATLPFLVGFGARNESTGPSSVSATSSIWRAASSARRNPPANPIEQRPNRADSPRCIRPNPDVSL
jgi:hypothetical protein